MDRHDDLGARIEGLMPFAQDLFDTLRRETFDGIGITRASYGEGEEVAYRIVAEAARGLGFTVTRDHAANLLVRLAGEAPTGEGVITGSHLDSVPNGGNYDGGAGVVAALVTLAALRDCGRAHRETITAIGMRGEETAWFGTHHLGSRAALGLIPAAELDETRRFDSGRTLGEHMADMGCDLDAVRAGRATFRPERVKAFFELHIEQGPVLVHEAVPVAIVTGIRGNVRVRAGRCLGEYAHTGAVPQNLRRDAVLAMCEFASAAEAECLRAEKAGRDMVLAFGKFHTDTDTHSHNKVPGELRFCLDIRSHELETLDAMDAFILAKTDRIARARGVTIEVAPLVRTRPAAMAPALRDLLWKAAGDFGVHAIDLASGGGHDAGDFAHAGVPAAMVFVRNPHGSHNPREDMALADFCQATKVLAGAVSDAAR